VPGNYYFDKYCSDQPGSCGGSSFMAARHPVSIDAGTRLGAVALARAVARDRAAVRHRAQDEGVQHRRLVEGNLSGRSVIVVEDVISTGGDRAPTARRVGARARIWL
jgi:orotate phosphoribosyltransferase